MSSSTFQLFHLSSLQGLVVARGSLPRPLAIPGYFRLEEREQLVTLLLTALRAATTPPGNLIRLSWSERELLQPFAGTRKASLTCRNNDLLWLVVEEEVEETTLFRFVDAIDALTLIDWRVSGGSEYVLWLATLKDALLRAIQHSWKRHAQHPDAHAVNFQRAGTWFESPLDVLQYGNRLAAELFAEHSLVFAERRAISQVLAARAAALPVTALQDLLLFALRERLPQLAPTLQLDEPSPDFARSFEDWHAAGLGGVAGDEFVPLPALERLTEIEVINLFVGHWAAAGEAYEPLRKLREKLHRALTPPEAERPLFLQPQFLSPSIPLNPHGTYGTPQTIRALIAPHFPALSPTATLEQVQDALQSEDDSTRRQLLMAWRAALWLEQAQPGDADTIRQAEAAVTRSLDEVWERLVTSGENTLALQAASLWARLRCVLADRLSERARVADAARLLPQAVAHLQAALEMFRALQDKKGQAEVLHEWGSLSERQGRPQESLSQWTQALDLFTHLDDLKGKAATLNNMAGVIAQQGDVERALALWQESLALEEQIGNVRGKAATLHDMAGVIAQQGDVQRALALWQESLALEEQIGNVQGKAATLSMMAGVIAQQGDVTRALALWQESLALKEQIGDVKGKAATLHQMAGVIAQQGDVTRALALWQESLALEEQIGNVRGKAATLASMAWLAERQGEPEKARRLNLEAAQALALVHAWLDLTTVLGNLGAAEDEAAKGWLGQAYWLAVRVSVPVEETLNLAAALLTRLGLAHEAAPLLAASAVILTQRRGADHPEREQLQQASIGMLRTCAEARNVTEEKSQEWITSNGFNDPARVLPQTLAALEQMVGAQAWLFDRAQV